MPALTPPKSASGAQLSAAELSRLQRAALLIALVLLVATLVFYGLAASAPNPLLAGIGGYFAWSGIVGAIYCLSLRVAAGDRAKEEYNRALEARSNKSDAIGRSDPALGGAPFLPDFAGRWQWLILLLGLVFGFALFAGHAGGNSASDRRSILQVAAVASLASGGMLYFLLHFANAIQARLKTSALDGLLYLTQIAFWAALSVAALLLVEVLTARDFSAWLGWPLIALTLALVAETLVRFGARFYQPAALRDVTTPAGRSLLLDAIFGHGKGWRSAVASFESLIGAKLTELWILQFVRQMAAPVILATVSVGWLSTCLTAIPAGSRGVRVVLGKYRPTSLAPGLHFTWPQPFEQVEIIPTEHVRNISLGFEKDLTRAVLWTEKHVEGEKNLLVGNGETLLTINVPILYRIADPVKFLETTTDPDEALANLAERKLIQLTGSRDSFAIMTAERAAIAAQLKKALQGEVNRLGFGLEILFVGLKDIHPPVDVAPAFQEVVSAEEQKESTIDTARADRADSLPTAQAQATRLRTTADAAYKQRVAQAEGEARRFELIGAAERANVALFRARVRLDTLQETLAKPVKVILGVPATYSQSFYLDLRNTGDLPPP